MNWTFDLLANGSSSDFLRKTMAILLSTVLPRLDEQDERTGPVWSGPSSVWSISFTARFTVDLPPNPGESRPVRVIARWITRRWRHE